MLCFLSLGLVLEMCHFYQVSWYLGAANETRRLMWTLGHVHGSLLGLLNTFFAAALCALPRETARFRWLSSPLLLAASVLLPGGFFLGGIFFYDGDPGLGIFLAPPAALMLLVAVLLIAISVTTFDQPAPEDASKQAAPGSGEPALTDPPEASNEPIPSQSS